MSSAASKRAYEERNPERASRKRSGSLATPEQLALKRAREARYRERKRQKYEIPVPAPVEPKVVVESKPRKPKNPCCVDSGDKCPQHRQWYEIRHETKGRAKWRDNPLTTPSGESLVDGFSVERMR